jgi:hypothetical protein
MRRMVGPASQTRCSHQPDHHGEPLGQLRHLVGVRVDQRYADGSPDYVVERVDGGGGLGHSARSGELAHARGKQLQRTTLLKAPKVCVIGERPDHGFAHPRPLACDFGREDRRHLFERRSLEQRQHPALRNVIQAREECIDGRVRDRPGGAVSWRTRLHRARISRSHDVREGRGL